MNKKILFTVCSTAILASAAANIDDFEDGNGLASTGGKDDAWYAFNDKNDGGASTYSNTKDEYGLVVVIPEAAAGGSKYGAGLTDIELVQGTNKYDPYVTLGLNVEGGLSGCTTISYKYKGAGHNLKAVMKGDEDGSLTEYNRHSKAFTSSTSWSTASVAVSGLAQDKGWGTTVALKMANVVQLAWEVKGEASPNYLYIDDVNCTGYAGGGSSSSDGPSTSALTGSTAVIDDFEDGNTTAENLGKTAYWYLYEAGGSFTNTQDANESWDILVKDGTNSYIEMKGISGITPGDTTYPSVGMEVAFDVSTLSGCTAVQYDYKGSGHHMRASVTGVKANAGYEHVAADQNAATAWKTVTVSTMTQPEWVADVAPSSIVAFSWAKVSKLTWVVDEKLSAANLGTSLAIDNVKCVGTLPSANKNSINVSAAPASFKAALQGNTLQMTVAKAGLVKIQVFDMMGHVVESHSENMAAGSFVHTFGSMPNGQYVVRVQQGSMMKLLKMQVR
ncbi:MAG: T9SS type A sorting domain-containing protein [Fibrobacter sp.]|nr:T9SS type A sorting domain-containing protein [Fibrobacter sp.]